MLNRLHRSLLCCVAVVLAAGACAGSSGKTATGTLSSTVVPAATTKIGHVFVINLENENYADSWSPASPAKYLNGALRAKGQLLTQYYAIGHVSLDNYIAQISGQSPNINTQTDCPTFSNFKSTGTGAYGQALGAGCVYPKAVKNIGDQLTAKGKTWKQYAQDMAKSPTQKTCRHPAIGGKDTTLSPTKTDMYATRHVPFVYFHSIIDSTQCKKKVVDLNALPTDLKSAATTPNLSYITPNVCNDGHDAPCKDGRPGGLVSADKFLQTWVPKILASPAYKAGGMLIVTFDEAEPLGAQSDSSACCNTPVSPNAAQPGLSGPGGGLVGALIVSTRTMPNSTNNTPYNHYSLLCSMENVFGLKHLGFAGAPGLSCFGADVYNKP
jgi:hypothetical protein